MSNDRNIQSSETVASLAGHVKDKLVTESKGLFFELLDHFLGDFKTFMTIFKTTGHWFIKPLSINTLEHQDPGSKFMGDFRLVKSLFLLFIIFLAFDAGATDEEATMNEYTVQITYLILFAISLVLFLFIGKIWTWITGANPENQRLFQGSLLYEFCTLFFIQGVVSGVLGIAVWDHQNDEFILGGTILAIIIPLAHALYFFFKLGKFNHARRNFIGLIFMLVIVGIYLIIPAIWNDMALKEGLL